MPDDTRSKQARMTVQFARILFVCGVSPFVACQTRTADVDLNTPNTQPQPDMVARVLGTDIFAADLNGTTAETRCRQLAVRLTVPLFEAYRREHSLAADESEIAACQASFVRPASNTSISASIARAMIVQYKLERQLYGTYGGDVIFQQGSPFQPVGAYRAFLKEQEQLGRFEILDEDYRECFWEQYSPANAFVWLKSEVDFSQPWWTKMQE